MQRYVDAPSSSPKAASMALDVGHALFLPMYRMRPGRDVQVRPDGRLRSRWPNATPALVHFNGESKGLEGAYSPGRLLATIVGRQVGASGVVSEIDQPSMLFPDVAFLTPTFERAGTSALAECGVHLRSWHRRL